MEIFVRCGVILFERWQALLEREPELWNVREVHGFPNRVAFNAATRKFWGIEERVLSWTHASRWVVQEDVERFESMQSHALKFGGVRQITIGVRVEANQVLLVPHTISSVYCPCGCKAAVILLLVTPPFGRAPLAALPPT